MKSYDYTNRDGIVGIDWLWFAKLAQQLAGELAAEGVDTVLSVGQASAYRGSLGRPSRSRASYPSSKGSDFSP